MKQLFFLISILAVYLPPESCTSSTSMPQGKIQQEAKIGGGFAVLELFTSQGCSSCPPADKLLSKIRSEKNVYALSFHVDYWNRLGWKDPFSDPAFSARQSAYASSLGSENVYTPQLVVNGREEMIGSDENKIEKAIEKFKAERTGTQLTIDSVKTGDSKISVTYTVDGNVINSVLQVALIQNSATTSIRSGENRGLQITNNNIVRTLTTIKLNSNGTGHTVIQSLPGIQWKELSVIMYVQELNTQKITAAVKADL
ncbi:MAG: DUF1223 domain-containing protein [Ginsengibacter sp.]